MLGNLMLGTKKILPNGIMKNTQENITGTPALFGKTRSTCLPIWEKKFFHFEPSSISLHPCDEQEAPMESLNFGCG